jgi:integrase
VVNNSFAMPQKPFRALHLELRYKTYYAVLTVPKDVRFVLGKKKFSKTTGTSNLRIAQTKAELFVIQWQSEIANARQDSTNPVLHSALELNKIRKSTPPHLFDDVLEAETNNVEQQTNATMAQTFNEVAKGKVKVLASYIDSWEKYQHARGLTEKNIHQMRRDLSILIDDVQTENQLNKDVCNNWIKAVATARGLSASSVTRIISACNNFYRYLQHISIFDEDAPSPFKVPKAYQVIDNHNAKALYKKEPWKPFLKEQVEVLYDAAYDKGDVDLANLIAIAAYSGTRIEEICSLTKEMVNLAEMTFFIDDSKTKAGIRVVPIHPKIFVLMEFLKSESNNGYIFCNLTSSKYGVRSNAIGKRFGRLKKAHGYGKHHVFHSIRKTFTTLMEQANIPEFITADIVGHEIVTMTYGLYSGGTSIEQRRSSMQHLNYKFPRKLQHETDTLENFF